LRLSAEHVIRPTLICARDEHGPLPTVSNCLAITAHIRKQWQWSSQNNTLSIMALICCVKVNIGAVVFLHAACQPPIPNLQPRNVSTAPDCEMPSNAAEVQQPVVYHAVQGL
jgi:hypothetical protein